MTNPTIEQAVKEIETGIEKLCKLGNGEHDGNSDGNVIAQSLRQHLTSLRALTEPSKTDEELAIKLRNDVIEKLFPIGWTDSDRQHHFLSIDQLITQAFTAIRAQARSEALEEVEKHFQDKLDDFDSKHTIMDFETGSYEYDNTDDSNYGEQLRDVIDAIRKLKDTK